MLSTHWLSLYCDLHVRCTGVYCLHQMRVPLLSVGVCRNRVLILTIYLVGLTELDMFDGRHDTGNNRQSTASNLQAAGYGSQCTDPNITESQPCYLQLDMRDPDDTRLESVYKPDKRAQLTARGYVIAGSLGDQWSDLAGTSPAIASFKLPNPMYYIL